MSIQVTTFVLCHIILPNLFVVTCISHCGECQLGGKFYAEICCLKHCLIVFQNIHFCFVCYFVVLWSRHMRVRCRGLCWSFLHVSVALNDHETACAVFQTIHFCFFITNYVVLWSRHARQFQSVTLKYTVVVIYLSITQ